MRAAIFCAALIASAAPAAAQDAIVAARAAGQVGERFDGYLGAVAAVSPAVRSQVAAVNIKRRSVYAGFAAQRGVAVQDVGIAAGCTLLARVAVGEAYLLPDAGWLRRRAGDPVPRPAYCG